MRDVKLKEKYKLDCDQCQFVSKIMQSLKWKMSTCYWEISATKKKNHLRGCKSQMLNSRKKNQHANFGPSSLIM